MREPRVPKRQLVAYGHSWVAGEAASRPEHRFTDRAAAALGMTLVNAGVGGSSTVDTAVVLTREGAIRADAYLVLAGLNDARLHGMDPNGLDVYASAMETVVAACAAAARHAVVLLVEQPPLLDYSGYAPHHRGSTVAVEAYNRRLAQVANRHREAVLVLVEEWDAARMLDADAVHPNDLGHAAIAAAVARTYGDASIGRTRPVHD